MLLESVYIILSAGTLFLSFLTGYFFRKSWKLETENVELITRLADEYRKRVDLECRLNLFDLDNNKY